MNPQHPDHSRGARIVGFLNSTGEEIPAHGLIELEGSDDEGFIAVKPRTDGCFCYVVLSDAGTPDGKHGQATTGHPIVIATDGTAAAGETWGAKADSFLAVLDYPGFRAMEDGISGLVFADRPTDGGKPPMELVNVTSRDSNGYGWPGTLYRNNGDGTWTADVMDVICKITPAGGDRFEVGDYWMQRNGGRPSRVITDGVTTKSSDQITSATGVFTAADVGADITGTGIPADTTVESVESETEATLSANATANGTGITFTLTIDMPIYFDPGNDEFPVNDCDNTDPEDPIDGYRLWSLRHPVHIDEFVAGDPP